MLSHLWNILDITLGVLAADFVVVLLERYRHRQQIRKLTPVIVNGSITEWVESWDEHPSRVA